MAHEFAGAFTPIVFESTFKLRFAHITLQLLISESRARRNKANAPVRDTGP